MQRPRSIDPFLELIRLLRPQATLWGAIRACGSWAVSFRARRDLLFFRVDSGRCLLIRPNQEPLRLISGDFVLIRADTPFSVASDLQAKPLDSEKLVAAIRSTEMVVGQGVGGEVVIRGGRFVFGTANEDLLTGLLPSFIHVRAGKTGSRRTRTLLAMNEVESLDPGPGGNFVVARLMELLLVELVRGTHTSLNHCRRGCFEVYPIR